MYYATNVLYLPAFCELFTYYDVRKHFKHTTYVAIIISQGGTNLTWSRNKRKIACIIYLKLKDENDDKVKFFSNFKQEMCLSMRILEMLAHIWMKSKNIHRHRQSVSNMMIAF